MRTSRLTHLAFVLCAVFAATGCEERGQAAQQAQSAAPTVALPNQKGSFKFMVLGDFGTGSREQYDLARQMKSLHDRFKFDTAVLVGDNLYGSERPQDFEKKFERP